MSFNAADIAAFMDNFGTPAVIQQPGQPDKPLTVIFDLNSLDLMGMSTDKPLITMAENDLVGIDLKAATITVTGKYPAARMTKPEPDGSGFITALLTRI